MYTKGICLVKNQRVVNAISENSMEFSVISSKPNVDEETRSGTNVSRSKLV